MNLIIAMDERTTKTDPLQTSAVIWSYSINHDSWSMSYVHNRVFIENDLYPTKSSENITGQIEFVISIGTRTDNET